MVRPGQGRRVQAHHVTAAQQGVQCAGLGAEGREFDGIGVGVVNEHLEVEGAQQLQHAPADEGCPDDADGATVVADGGVAAQQVDGCPGGTVGVRGFQHSLVGEQDRGQRVLGHRHRVGGGGAGDEQATFPAGLGDMVFDAPGGMDDGPQPRHPFQRVRVEDGTAPTGEQHFHLVETPVQPGIHVGEISEEDLGVDVRDPDEFGQNTAAEDGGPGAGAHGEHRRGTGGWEGVWVT